MTLAVAIATMLFLPGCGGGGGASTTTGTSASVQRTVGAGSPGSEGVETDAKTQDSAPAPDDGLASSACKALPLSAAESFDPRLTGDRGGGNTEAVSTCHYDALPSERPPFQLILELIPPPSEASEYLAKRVCREVIAEIKGDPNYESSHTVSGLGEESNVANGFVKAELNLDEDETIYVADWREDGTCARLIYSSVGPGSVEPLSEFIELAESVNNSG